MAKIFIAYRRSEGTFFVNAIEDELQRRFGKRSVIRDVNARIPLGTDFRKYLRDAVANSDILLVIIGTRWVETMRERAEDATDFLRIEIEAALEAEIPVVPILVGGASMPTRKDLPDSISEMIYLEGAKVQHRGKRLYDELEELSDRLAEVIAIVGKSEEDVASQEFAPPVLASPDQGLVLLITVKPKTGGIGIQFRWTLTVRNDGSVPFRNVAVFRNESQNPLEDPFDLDPGRGRRLGFRSHYRAPGKKTNAVHAVATAASGQEIRVATKTSVQVS